MNRAHFLRSLGCLAITLACALGPGPARAGDRSAAAVPPLARRAMGRAATDARRLDLNDGRAHHDRTHLGRTHLVGAGCQQNGGENYHDGPCHCLALPGPIANSSRVVWRRAAGGAKMTGMC